MNIRIILFAICLFGFTVSVNAQFKVGVQLFTFRNQMPGNVAAILDSIKKMGIDEVEGGELYNLQVDEYNGLLEKSGLMMIGVHTDFNELDSNIEKAYNRAKNLNAKYITCYWIPHTGNEFGIKEVKKAVAVFSQAGKYFKERGISLCYHPHGYEFRLYKNGTLFDFLANNTDRRYVNFELDVFWAKHGGADPAKLLKKYPGRFPLLHLKDRQKGTPGNPNGQADVETNVVLGQGDVDINAVLKAAKKAGVKHYFIEDESSRCMQQVPESVKYLQSFK